MRRRDFLALSTGLALGAGGLTGCSVLSPSGPGRLSSRNSEVPPSADSAPPQRAPRRRPDLTGSSTIPPGGLARLGASLTGHVVRPGDSGYPAARMVYDLRYSSETPTAIAYCAGPQDVARCIEFARQAGLAPIPRCGGHSYGGYSTGPGLVIDVTGMTGVQMASTGRAEVRAGTLLVDLYTACAAAGVLIPGGSCPTVGVSGLTLGGGMGVVGRRYGLTCDNLTAVDIVTADGRTVRCDEETEPDLFWACRGGGGRNFGIVTSFEFVTNPVPPLALFAMEWSWTRVSDVLAGWQVWVETAPVELWSNCQLLYRGVDGPVVRCSGVFTGTPPALHSLVDRLLASTGPPAWSSIREAAFLPAMLAEAGCAGLSPAQCHLSGQTIEGLLPRTLFRARSAFMSAPFPEEGLRAAAGVFAPLEAKRSSVGAAVLFDAMGGIINSIDPQATAFVHRTALCSVQLTVTFAPTAPEAAVAAGAAWLAGASAALAPYGNGEAYQNYIDPDLAGWAHAYYGANLPRLQAVKSRYDPDDVFAFPQGITAGGQDLTTRESSRPPDPRV